MPKWNNEIILKVLVAIKLNSSTSLAIVSFNFLFHVVGEGSMHRSFMNHIAGQIPSVNQMADFSNILLLRLWASVNFLIREFKPVPC